MDKPFNMISNEELNNLISQVWEKYPEDWTIEDMKVLFEDKQRKQKNVSSELNSLNKNKEFVLEDWIKFIAERVKDNYILETDNQYWIYVIRRKIGKLPNFNDMEELLTALVSVLGKKIQEVKSDVLHVGSQVATIEIKVSLIQGVKSELDRIIGGLNKLGNEIVSVYNLVNNKIY